MSRQSIKIVFAILFAGLVAAFFIFDLGQFLTLEYLKSQQQEMQRLYLANQWLTIVCFFGLYVGVTALSLPGAAVLTLAAGAIFGLFIGTAIVSLASTIGATLALMVSRFLLSDWVQKKFGDSLASINRGIQKEGTFYLFTLRLIPVFPFFLVNLVMGLTPIRTVSFFFVSMAGMFPGTVAYIYAGQEISKIDSLKGIISPGLLLAFALLGLLPIVSKKIIDLLRAKKVYRGYEKPKNFDYNIVVIGAGSAGLVSALIAATVKAKVALIEKHKMGGDCLNTGCVPSKAIIKTAKVAKMVRDHKKYGLADAHCKVDLRLAMQRVQSIIKRIEPHDSVERFTGLGVECFMGDARITSPWQVEVDGKSLTTKNIIVATGAAPFVPPIEGIGQVNPKTSDTIWEMEELPKRLVVLGGGPIGCELAQTFARLGSSVTHIERFHRIMGREDEDASSVVYESFINDGIDVLTEHTATRFQLIDGVKTMTCEKTDGTLVEIEFDEVLVALGRRANVSGFGLEELGISVESQGTIEHDEFLRTRFPNIYVCGDVAGPFQFTHTASHQAWFATVNALFSPFKTFKADYRVIPWCTYTDPEVARVGLSELEAEQKGIQVEVIKYSLKSLDRAIAESDDSGFVKVLVRPGTDKVMGATIVGPNAGDLIQEYVLAMKHGIGLNKIMGTIHTYPTLVEANKFVASEWKKKHKPEKLLQYVERFHAWRRS